MDISRKIDEMISNQEKWKQDFLMILRKLIHDASPSIKEEWKWEVPIFVNKKMVCSISPFKNHVKINFFKGAFLSDKNKLFKPGQTSKQHRGIDFFEGDKIDEPKMIELIQEAVEYDK